MKFRIRKENGLYFAEYKWMFLWLYIYGSISKDIEQTRKACMDFGQSKIVESFEL